MRYHTMPRWSPTCEKIPLIPFFLCLSTPSGVKKGVNAHTDIQLIYNDFNCIIVLKSFQICRSSRNMRPVSDFDRLLPSSASPPSPSLPTSTQGGKCGNSLPICQIWQLPAIICLKGTFFQRQVQVLLARKI